MISSAERAALRALAYRFLATLYLDAPKTEWLAALYADGLLEEFPVPLGNDEMARGLAMIAGAAAAPDQRALAADYQQLFVGPGHLPAPPWESVYRTEERLVFDWPTLLVREAYGEMGLRLPEPAEPDDHIGLELLFMAVLAEREAAGDAAAAAAQDAFLREHLLAWAPTFCSDVEAHAATDLYCGLGLLTRGLLDQERLLLAAEA